MSILGKRLNSAIGRVRSRRFRDGIMPVVIVGRAMPVIHGSVGLCWCKRRLLQQVVHSMRRGVKNKKQECYCNEDAGFAAAAGWHYVFERFHEPKPRQP